MVKQSASIERYDENGYPRGKLNHSDLLHRQIAYNEIYLKDKEKYPLPFSKYVVHHKDKDKENFNSENLQLLTKEEHERVHQMISKNKRLYQYYHQKEIEWKIKVEQERKEKLNWGERIRPDEIKHPSPEDIYGRERLNWMNEEKKKAKKWKWLNLIGIKQKPFHCLDCNRRIIHQGRCLTCNKRRKKERGE